MKYAIPIACVMLSFIAGWMARGVFDLNAVNHARQIRNTPQSAAIPDGEFRVPSEPIGGYQPLPSGGVNDLRSGGL